MSDAVTLSSRDGVAVVMLHNPPVNGLGFAVRTGLQTALDLIVIGTMVPAYNSRALGMIDEVVEGNVVDAATGRAG